MQQQKNAQAIAQAAQAGGGADEDDKDPKQQLQRTRAPVPAGLPQPPQANKPGVVSTSRRKVVDRGGMTVEPQGMSGSDRM